MGVCASKSADDAGDHDGRAAARDGLIDVSEGVISASAVRQLRTEAEARLEQKLQSGARPALKDMRPESTPSEILWKPLLSLA